MSDGTRGFSLKDQLFNPEKVTYLANLLKGADSEFDAPAFTTEVTRRFPELELKERIAWIADNLAARLPEDFEAAAKLLTAALPPPLDPTKTDDDFGDFIFAPFGEYVARHGKGVPDLALATLREITMRFSMEDAIRTYLASAPDATLDTLEDWARDDNYHVRRLVSEGTRPRLPWSIRLSLPEDRVMGLLDHLQADPTRYVTRSVANHLNDIAKDAPDRVIAALTRWQSANRQSPKELDWITRHALRTLIKTGHPDAMALLGYAPNPDISVALSVKTPEVRIGTALSFEIELKANTDSRLLIDYAIGFRKANGTANPKVFKLKTLDLKANAEITLEKSHRLLGNATTYTLYPGPHELVLQINGQTGPRATFALL